MGDRTSEVGSARRSGSIGSGISRQFSEVLERQPSKALAEAASRGKTRLERKAAWPFDFYQNSGFYPVDYNYWWSPFETSCGSTQLVMMHAVALVEDGSSFGADQVEHRSTMKEAHKVATRAMERHQTGFRARSVATD